MVHIDGRSAYNNVYLMYVHIHIFPSVYLEGYWFSGRTEALRETQGLGEV